MAAECNLICPYAHAHSKVRHGAACNCKRCETARVTWKAIRIARAGRR